MGWKVFAININIIIIIIILINYLIISFHRPWSDAIRSVTKFNGDVVGQHYKLENLTLFIIRDAGYFCQCYLF